MTRIVFMGTPSFAVAPLHELCQAGHHVVAAYTKAPKQKGRGKRVAISQVHEYAQSRAIPVYHPSTLKDPKAQEELAALKPDLIVVVAYGLILPEAITSTYLCLNIHASLLPKWRGAAPIQRAIEAGDNESGVTIMKMDAGLDTGDMLLTKSCPITKDTNASILHDKLAALGAAGILEAIKAIQDGTMRYSKQPEHASYAHKITKSEAEINWQDKGAVIVQKINAFNPYPGAYTETEYGRLKILKAEHSNKEEGDLLFPCDDGFIKPLIVQREGKKAMQVNEFMRGVK